MTDIGKKASSTQVAADGQTTGTSIDLSKIAGLRSDSLTPAPTDDQQAEQELLSPKIRRIINAYVPKIKAELLRTTGGWIAAVGLVSEAEGKGVKGKMAMTQFARELGFTYSSVRKMVNIDRDEELKAFLEIHKNNFQVDGWTQLDEIRKIIKSSDLKTKFANVFFAGKRSKPITRDELRKFRKSNGLGPKPKPKTTVQLVLKRAPDGNELAEYSARLQALKELPFLDVKVGEDLKQQIKEEPWKVRKPAEGGPVAN